MTKELISHVLIDRENKEMGDEELVKGWKEHYHENQMMRKTIDHIALKLGIVLELVVAGEISVGMRSRILFPVHGLKAQHTTEVSSHPDGLQPGAPVARASLPNPK